MDAGHGPGDFVLDGTQLSYSQRGQTPNFRPMSIAAKRKTALGTEVGLGPGHIVIDRDPAPLPKMGRSPSPIFGPFLLWPNGWMH